MTKFDVIGFGALNVDSLFKVDKIAGAEEESSVIDYSESCGGSAANVMVGLARLGCRTGFIGKVADDREGKMHLDAFKAEGVNTEGITVAKQGRSGLVMGFVDKKGQRALYINAGANDFVEPREIKWEYVSQTKLLHLTSFVGEKSLRTQKKLVGSLPQGVEISFDPGSVYAQKGFAAIEPLIRNASVMMPNALELELLTGESDYQKGARVLIDAGVKIVAVKLGAKGCYVTDGTEQCRVEAYKVNATDTTGAGDAYCAGFLYGIINQKTLTECGRLGNWVASRKVTKTGARTGLPYEKDLATFG
ncbi:MAG: carbohydrate kinase family protein [Candidatus Bathyarchaeota archaeon]|nr:carbohydrate kinase family protein [Candidatus Bathyarchaeota archaeon]